MLPSLCSSFWQHSVPHHSLLQGSLHSEDFITIKPGRKESIFQQNVSHKSFKINHRRSIQYLYWILLVRCHCIQPTLKVKGFHNGINTRMWGLLRIIFDNLITAKDTYLKWYFKLFHGIQKLKWHLRNLLSLRECMKLKHSLEKVYH